MNRTAFSLIELVIVVALIGIVAAIAAPRYGQAAARYRATLAAERIAEELRFASEYARANEATVYAAADTLTERLVVKPASGPFAGKAVSELDLSRPPYEADLYFAVRGAGMGSPSFDARGLAEEDAQIGILVGRLYIKVRVLKGARDVEVSSLSIFGEAGSAWSEEVVPGVIEDPVFLDPDAARVELGS